MGDVARIELGMEEAQMRSRYDQDLVVFLPIYAAPGASEIAVADALYERIEDINKILPDDLELIMAFDISNYMRDSLREIVMTLGETILLVGFVVVALMGEGLYLACADNFVGLRKGRSKSYRGRNLLVLHCRKCTGDQKAASQCDQPG